MELRAGTVHYTPHIMAGRQAIGAELPREGDQIGELHALVAQRARDRCAAFSIFVDEPIDHTFAEAAFVIEDVVGKPKPVSDRARVVNILPSAARPGALHRFPVIVKLHGDADDIGATANRQSSRDRAVDAARHGDDDPRAVRGSEAEIDGHCRCGGALYPNFTPPD